MAQWIDDPAALDRAVARLQAAPLLAVDCESNAMYAYRGRVCVVQLAVASANAPADDVVLVDTHILGVEGLRSLLSAEGPPKVLHDFGFDARILAAAGVTLGNAADTAVHARLLGMAETGLARLLGQRFGLALDKRFQHHDWGKRPLRDDARRYLEADVSHLGLLHAQLAAEATALGISDEIDCETSWALAHALADAADLQRQRRPPFARIKGFRELRGVSRAILREVAATREAIAEARDLPIGRVLPNAVVLGIARDRPADPAALRAALGANHAAAPWSAVWHEAVARALASPGLSEDERAWFNPERPGGDPGLRRARAERLNAWRREEAARRGVDLQVVLPGHCLEALASQGLREAGQLDELQGFGPSRRARYAETLVALLNAPLPARE